MNCKEFKKISLLFIDHELTEAENNSAINHISTCALCSSYLSNLGKIYNEADTVLNEKKTDHFFYTRLKARMESEISLSNKGFIQISNYLQPAFYVLIAFTLFLSILMFTGNVTNKQQNTNSSLIQFNNSDEQDYLKTIAMNEQTFEEDYINIINK